MVQWPPTGVHCGSVVQAAFDTLQCPLRTHEALSKQAARSMVHCPGCVGQSGRSFLQIALVIVQWPSFGQLASAMQLLLSVLQ